MGADRWMESELELRRTMSEGVPSTMPFTMSELLHLRRVAQAILVPPIIAEDVQSLAKLSIRLINEVVDEAKHDDARLQEHARELTASLEREKARVRDQEQAMVALRSECDEMSRQVESLRAHIRDEPERERLHDALKVMRDFFREG